MKPEYEEINTNIKPLK